MKKLTTLLLALLLVLTLSGCDKTEEVEERPVEVLEDTHLKIMAPLGSPALAQTYMQSTMPSLGEQVTYEISVVSGTDPLIAAFGSGTHDIIYAPTNLGAKLYSTGVDYQLAAVVVWGNLYLATGTDEAFTLADLEGKTIVVFGENATPHIVLKTIIDNYNYTNPPTFEFVADAGTANATLIQDPSKIVLLAEPVLSVASLPSNVANIKTIDLQTEWENLTGSSSYPQAGIFVKRDVPAEALEAYLAQVQLSITEALNDPAAIATMTDELGYGFPVPVMTGAISRSHLQYVSALNSKEALEEYFQYIIDFNSALIGGALPVDDFYYGE